MAAPDEIILTQKHVHNRKITNGLRYCVYNAMTLTFPRYPAVFLKDLRPWSAYENA
jgi:hypothetical protein